ncbi:MAG: DUF1523 family protein [Maricaulaceae bacterium]
MTTIKRLLFLVIFIFVGAVLCYFLPNRDIVQVVGIEVSREDFKNIDQSKTGYNRDVRYINAEWPNGKPRVYRNEDANLYLKFDSGNINAQAQSLGNKHANQEAPVWVAVNHYGWRIPILSMYPNALNIKPVDGPNAKIIPWFNIIFLSALFLLCCFAWWKWRQFKKKRIDPVTDKIEEQVDAVTESVSEELSETGGAIKRLFRKFFGSGKKN